MDAGDCWSDVPEDDDRDASLCSRRWDSGSSSSELDDDEPLDNDMIVVVGTIVAEAPAEFP